MLCVISTSSLPDPCQRTLLLSFSRSFRVPGFTFKYLIHVELVFVIGVRCGPSFHSSCVIIQLSSAIYQRDSLFSIEYSWLPCQILVDCICLSVFMALKSVPWSICLVFCQYHTVLMTIVLQYSLKSGSVMPSACFYIPSCVLSPFSHVQFFTTVWTIACQAPLSMGFSRQEY